MNVEVIFLSLVEAASFFNYRAKLNKKKSLTIWAF